MLRKRKHRLLFYNHITYWAIQNQIIVKHYHVKSIKHESGNH